MIFKNNKKTINEKMIIIPFILIVTLLICLLGTIPNDYWWHVKAGEYIFNTKSIPYTDVFSWIGIKEGLAWYSHEWLSEIVIYVCSILFNGTFGGFIFVYVVISILMLALYFTNKSFFNKNFIFSIFWFTIGAICLSPILSPRPHMISFVLLAITMFLLMRYKNNENFKGIWFIPAISLLWANFHGGSSNLSYTLAIIVLVSGLFKFKIGKIIGKKLTLKQIKTLIIVIIFSILSIIINPHGFDMIIYPYSNMNDSLMLSFINEWQSPDIKNLSQIKYLLAVIITFLIFMSSKKDIDFTDFLFFCGFTYLSLKSIRFGALSYIVLTYTIINYIEGINLNDFFNLKVVKYFFSNFMVVCISVLIIYITLLGMGHMPTKLFAPAISDELVNTIKETNPKALYNEYDLGGYLIYKDIKVSIDGRADLYSKNILGDYIGFAQKLNMNLPNKYNFDYYLVFKNRTLYNYFEIHKDQYELIGKDEAHGIYYYKKL